MQLWCLTWYKDMLTSRREMSHRGGGRWSLEQACVWEPSVIHTLLIPIQLCSIKSLRHFTKRGALFGVLWVFVSESLKKKKRPPVKQMYASFVSTWLIKGSSFIHFLCFTDSKHPGGRSQRYYLFHQELSTRQCYILNNEQSTHFVLFFNLSVLPVYRL